MATKILCLSQVIEIYTNVVYIGPLCADFQIARLLPSNYLCRILKSLPTIGYFPEKTKGEIFFAQNQLWLLQNYNLIYLQQIEICTKI